MALILEFRKKLTPVGKSLPVAANGSASVIFFTGVRYERITASEVAMSAKRSLSRKTGGQKRGRPVEVLA
jgi:hypothetical protein